MKRIIMVMAMVVFLGITIICYADEPEINSQYLAITYGPDFQQFCLVEYGLEFQTNFPSLAIVKIDLFLGGSKRETIYQLVIGKTSRTLSGYWYVPYSWAWRDFTAGIELFAGGE